MKKIEFILVSVFLMTACSKEHLIKIQVTNPISIDRSGEMVELSWVQISENLGLKQGEQFVILDSTSSPIPYQLIKAGGQSVQSVIFPVTIQAGKSIRYTLKKGIPEKYSAQTFGRLVPERKDDFAWENNRIAFRMYGPALEATGEISNGIDLWVKKTDNLVIDKWYKDDLAGVASYHKDHGEGLDCYKVGRTLGAGAAAPFVNDSLWLGNNFISYEILDNGPLRTTFRLTYAPFNVNGHFVTETRTISLDANSQMNKIVEHFETDTTGFTLAFAIVTRPEEGGIKLFSASDAVMGYMAYAEPETENGRVFSGVVSATNFTNEIEASNHLLALGKYTTGTDYTYFAGGGWSQSKFSQPDDWFQYVESFALAVQHPLTLTLN